MATKQEKIKEGLAHKLAELEGFSWACVVKDGFEDEWQGKADDALSYLRSQDVMVKVGEISVNLAQAASQCDTYYAEKVGFSWERTAYLFKAFKEAGYVAVESLIEKEG